MNKSISDIAWARRLKYRHLEVFLAIVEARGITAAAESLHMTQSAVSHWLAEIESLIGLPLCERRRAHFCLTPAGTVLLSHAGRMVGDIRRTHQDLQALNAGLSGRLHIGTILSATPGLLPHAIASFQADSPDVLLNMTEGTQETLLAKLELRELDLIIGTLDIRAHRHGLSQELLLDDDLRIVAGKHSTFALNSAAQWAEVGNLPWIMPPQGTLMRQCLEQAFMDNGIAIPVPRIETASIITLQSMLGQTNYLSVLSRSVAAYYQSAGLLATIPIKPGIPFAKIGMVWKNDNDTPQLARFRARLAATAQATREVE